MRCDHDRYGDDAAMVLGRVVVEDASGGQGHSWCTVHRDDLPAAIAQEIECEIIDGGHETCDDYRASNGQHYAWGTEEIDTAGRAEPRRDDMTRSDRRRRGTGQHTDS